MRQRLTFASNPSPRSTRLALSLNAMEASSRCLAEVSYLHRLGYRQYLFAFPPEHTVRISKDGYATGQFFIVRKKEGEKKEKLFYSLSNLSILQLLLWGFFQRLR